MLQVDSKNSERHGFPNMSTLYGRDTILHLKFRYVAMQGVSVYVCVNRTAEIN